MNKSITETLKAEREELLESIKPILESIKPTMAKVETIEKLLKLYDNADVVDATEARRQIAQMPKTPKTPEGASADNIISIITKGGVCVKNAYIAKMIFGATPTEDEKNSVSGVLAYLKRQGKLDSYKEGNNNVSTVWGLKDWFGSNGKPLEEYS